MGLQTCQHQTSNQNTRYSSSLNAHRKTEKLFKGMTLIERSRHLAYQPVEYDTPVYKGLRECRKRLKEYSLKVMEHEQNERVKLPTIDENEKPLSAKNYGKVFRKSARNNEAVATHRIVAAQRTASNGARLEALLLPSLYPMGGGDGDVISGKERRRIEVILSDDLSANLRRVISC